MDDEDCGDWQPPNESERKVLEAKRERNNQISRLMGNYLLKGYRMLDQSCVKCNNILLQDRNAQYYCVACNELESETSKDDPAVSAEAAAAAVKEQEQKLNRNVEKKLPQPAILSDEEPGSSSSFVVKAEVPDSPTKSTDIFDTVLNKETVDSACAKTFSDVHLVTSYMRIKYKIEHLSKKLVECVGLEATKELCDAIQACAATAQSIRQLL